MTTILMLSISNFKFLTPALNEGRTLGRAGYQVDVYTLRNNDEAVMEELGPGFRVYRWDLATRFLPKRPLFWLLKYIEFILRAMVIGITQPPIICVAHNLDTLIPAYFIAKFTHAKLIYRAHELSSEIDGVLLARVWRWIERQLLKKVDVVVVPNEERGEILMTEYGAPKVPVVVMNCPLLTQPVCSTNLRDFLQRHELAHKHIALFQGRLGKDRCTDELVMAGQYLEPGNIIVLLGPSPVDYRTHLESMINKMNLNKKVLLHDPVPYDELLAYTCSADIGIILYANTDRNNYYCAPNKLFEYFMAGLPIVAADFPGLRRLVEQNGVGLVVEPNDPIQIAEAINTILRNPQIASQMRLNALKNAQIYNWERESAKLLEIYKTLSVN